MNHTKSMTLSKSVNTKGFIEVHIITFLYDLVCYYYTSHGQNIDDYLMPGWTNLRKSWSYVTHLCRCHRIRIMLHWRGISVFAILWRWYILNSFCWYWTINNTSFIESSEIWKPDSSPYLNIKIFVAFKTNKMNLVLFSTIISIYWRHTMVLLL